MPTATDDCLDLVGKLLQFNPDKRLSAQGALTHPYVLRYGNLYAYSVLATCIGLSTCHSTYMYMFIKVYA